MIKMMMAAANIPKTSVLANIPKTSISPKITECSICMLTFTKPKSLPCIHTFCLDCLKTLVKDTKPGNQMPCPMCRQLFTIPPAGVSAIPNNLFIEHILEMEAILDKETMSQENVCDLCGDDEERNTSATGHCIECRQNLCQKCSALHKKQQFGKSHNIVIFEDKNASQSIAKLRISYCAAHKEEQLKLFCYNCNQTVCLMCFAVGHKGHDCSDINESSENFKKQLAEHNVKMNQLITATEKEMNSLDNDKARHLQDVDVAQRTITKQCNDLVAIINAQQELLKKELNNLKDVRIKQFETRKTDLASKLVTMQSFVQYSNEMLEKGSPCDISRSANELILRSDQLLKEQAALNAIQLNKYELKFNPQRATENSIVVGALLINNKPPGSAINERATIIPSDEDLLDQNRRIGNTKEMYCPNGCRNTEERRPQSFMQLSNKRCKHGCIYQRCQVCSMERVRDCPHGFKQGDCPNGCKIDNRICVHGYLLR